MCWCGMSLRMFMRRCCGGRSGGGGRWRAVCRGGRAGGRGPGGAGPGGRGPVGGAVRAVIVVDASVLANVVGDDGADEQRVRRELRAAGDPAAPDLVDVETMAVLRKRWV